MIPPRPTTHNLYDYEPSHSAGAPIYDYDQSYSPYDYGQHLSREPFSAPPSLTPIHTNPLMAGVQLGMLGAAAGLGVAGVQRAIRLRTPGAAPPHVVRSMLIGSIIGAGLGVGGSMMATPKPQPVTSWHDLSDKINNDLYGKPLHKTSAYSGLRHIVKQSSLEKKAVVVSGGLALVGLIAKVGLTHALRIWAAYSAAQALKHGGKAIGAAAKGDSGKAWAHAGQAGLNVIYASPLGAYGKTMQGVAKGHRAMNTVKKITPLWRRAGQGTIDLSRKGAPNLAYRPWNPLAGGAPNPVSKWYGPKRFKGIGPERFKGIGPERFGAGGIPNPVSRYGYGPARLSIPGNIKQTRVEGYGRWAQRRLNQFAATRAGQRVAANPALQKMLKTRGKTLAGVERGLAPAFWGTALLEPSLPPGGIPEWQEQRHQYRLDKPALRQRARRAMRPRRPQITAPNIW